MTIQRRFLEAVEQKQLWPLDTQSAPAVVGSDNPAVVLAAALFSREAGEGHVCLPLPRLPPSEDTHPLLSAWLAGTGEPEDWAECLLVSSAVSRDGQPTPLALYGERPYLNQMRHSERAVARFFSKVNHTIEVDEQRLIHTLTALFPPSEGVNRQKVVAVVALTRRVSVISDGPGTGKTTTVARLLAALIQMADGECCRIRLVAPTGKVAIYLTSSLGMALRELPLTDEQKKRIPGDTSTLYRSLGAQPGSQRLCHHAGNPLYLNVLVVDEVLVIGLSMMLRLIDALPPHGRVIFLGDRDQFASVEAGAVLGDICAFVGDELTSECAHQLSCLTGSAIPTDTGTQAAALRDSLCLLRKSYRFGSDSGIGQLAAAVNCGDKSAIKTISQQGFSDIEKHTLHSSEDYAAALDGVLVGYGHYLDLLHEGAEPGVVIQASNEYQLLCVLREGPFGVSGLNERIEQVMAQKCKTHRSTHSR